MNSQQITTSPAQKIASRYNELNRKQGMGSRYSQSQQNRWALEQGEIKAELDRRGNVYTQQAPDWNIILEWDANGPVIVAPAPTEVSCPSCYGMPSPFGCDRCQSTGFVAVDSIVEEPDF